VVLFALPSLKTVAGQVGAVAHLPQQAQRQLLVHHVVLGQKDAKRVAGGHLGIDAGLGRRGNASGCGVLRQQRNQLSCAAVPFWALSESFIARQ
jgi:hypothetical protein